MIKKILNVGAAAVLAMVAGMMISCTPAAGGGNDTSPLFTEDELTVELKYGEVTLADGDYKLKVVQESDSMSGVAIYEFTVKNGVETYTSATINQSGTIPEGTTPEQLEMAKKEGYVINGNHASIQKTYTEEELKKMSGKNMSGPTYAFKYGNGVKTNAERTKFFLLQTYTESGKTSTQKYYLEKK